jgi:hypothetical protein
MQRAQTLSAASQQQVPALEQRARGDPLAAQPPRGTGHREDDGARGLGFAHAEPIEVHSRVPRRPAERDRSQVLPSREQLKTRK